MDHVDLSDKITRTVTDNIIGRNPFPGVISSLHILQDGSEQGNRNRQCNGNILAITVVREA